MEQSGGRLEFVTEDFEDSAAGRFMRSAKSFASEVEREKLTERTVRGRRERAHNGKYLPSAHAPYGYQWGDEERTYLTIDPVTSLIVHRIFELYAGGMSLRQIVRDLGEQGILSPRGKEHWNSITIKAMIANPLYRGDAYAWCWKTKPTANPQAKSGRKYRDLSDAIKLPDGIVPPIIDDVLWNTVQERLKGAKHQSRPQSKNREAALLRGGFAKCGYCGWNATPIKSSDGYWFYRCEQIGKPGCTCPAWTLSVPKIDAVIWDKVARRLLDGETIRAELERRLGDDPTAADVSATERAINDIVRRQTNIAKSISLIDDQEAQEPLVRELEALRSQQKALAQERDLLLSRRQNWESAQRHIDSLEAWCNQVASNLDSLDYDQRREALQAFGVRVTIYRTGHDPRYEIRATIPLDVTSETQS
jgi:site-specific DNA recombinase